MIDLYLTLDVIPGVSLRSYIYMYLLFLILAVVAIIKKGLDVVPYTLSQANIFNFTFVLVFATDVIYAVILGLPTIPTVWGEIANYEVSGMMTALMMIVMTTASYIKYRLYMKR